MSLKIYPLRLGINRCYIIKDEGMIMIDGGPPGKLKQIQKFLEANSLPAGEIQLIILTHGDFDHIGSAKDIKDLTGGMIAIHANDKINLEKSVYNFPLGVTRWGRISRSLLNPIMKKAYENSTNER